MGAIEKCPLCGSEMEKGYITAGQGIYWSEKRTSWWTPVGDENLAGSRWSGACVEAYRCPNCKIVLFSYEKEKSRKAE